MYLVTWCADFHKGHKKKRFHGSFKVHKQEDTDGAVNDAIALVEGRGWIYDIRTQRIHVSAEQA